MALPPSTSGIRLNLSLRLPRDRFSVPLARHLLSAAMNEIGVVADDEAAVALALSEACTNVVHHAGAATSFQVSISIDPMRCELHVVDEGCGSRPCAPYGMPELAAERGRGLALMQALVDRMVLDSEPDLGTTVHLVKRLHFEESAPGRRLSSAAHPAPAPAVTSARNKG